MNKSLKIEALSKVTKRSVDQTTDLLKFCNGDFNTLLALEQKLKENFITYAPFTKEDVQKILDMPEKKYPWKDIIKDYIFVLLKLIKKN